MSDYLTLETALHLFVNAYGLTVLSLIGVSILGLALIKVIEDGH